MTELLPCPFCGGEAQRYDIDGRPFDTNVGGSGIECKSCHASTALHFDRKENLISSWNDRTASAATPMDARYWKFRNVVENLVFDPIRRGGRAEAEILNQLKMMSEEHYAKPNCYTDVAATPMRSALERMLAAFKGLQPFPLVVQAVAEGLIRDAEAALAAAPQAQEGAWHIFETAMMMLGDVPGETLLERITKLQGRYMEMQIMVGDLKHKLEVAEAVNRLTSPHSRPHRGDPA